MTTATCGQSRQKTFAWCWPAIKGALDAIYNRALREDPTLQGKVVFEIKGGPTGEVLSCKVVFSDLHSPA